ncbi:MAG: O-antigen ligase family protein [Pseudomonadota bacterium]
MVNVSNPRLTEYAFAVFSLLLFSGGYWHLLAAPNTHELERSALLLIRSIFISVYAISLLLLLPRWRQALRAAVTEKSVVTLGLLAMLSTMWSDLPVDTFRSGIALLGTTLFGVYLGVSFRASEQVALLFFATSIAAMSSFAVTFMYPDYGLMQTSHVGAWRGIYPHKNMLGFVMVLGLLSAYLLSNQQERYRFLTGTMFGLFLVMLMLTVSKASLGHAVMLSILLLGVAIHIRRSDLAVVGVITLTLAGASLVGHLAAYCEPGMPSALTRTGTCDSDTNSVQSLRGFTGRTDLWAIAMERIEKRPLTGYGFYATWKHSKEFNEELQEREINWDPDHAHNGYLDLLLNLGILGMVVFLAGFSRNTVNAVRRARRGCSWIAFWPILFLGLLVIVNLLESALVVQNNIAWVLYVAISVDLHMRRKNLKTQDIRSLRN